jgi:diphthamide synthase (EF-2-diphthine--ammonia ligase)
MAAVSWSGGKDSRLAYLRAQSNFSFAYAITMMNEDSICADRTGSGLKSFMPR